MPGALAYLVVACEHDHQGSQRVTANLAKQVDDLAREVCLMRSSMSKTDDGQRPWWERLAGEFKDDPLFDEIVKAGRKYRKQAGLRT